MTQKTREEIDPQVFTKPTTFRAAKLEPITVGLIAGTTQTQAGAVQLGTDYNVVATCANANDGARLPKMVAGMVVQLKNAGAQNLKIWPAVGEKCNGGTVDAADTTVLAAGAKRTYICTTDGDAVIY